MSPPVTLVMGWNVCWDGKEIFGRMLRYLHFILTDMTGLVFRVFVKWYARLTFIFSALASAPSTMEPLLSTLVFLSLGGIFLFAVAWVWLSEPLFPNRNLSITELFSSQALQDWHNSRYSTSPLLAHYPPFQVPPFWPQFPDCFGLCHLNIGDELRWTCLAFMNYTVNHNFSPYNSPLWTQIALISWLSFLYHADRSQVH